MGSSLVAGGEHGEHDGCHHGSDDDDGDNDDDDDYDDDDDDEYLQLSAPSLSVRLGKSRINVHVSDAEGRNVTGKSPLTTVRVA